jgi:heterodisulfide reductase subunit A
MNGSRPRVGVYICHCGINIGAAVDVAAVGEYAAALPGVTASRHNLYMCSQPGQNLIKEDIRSGLINRVVVASCSPRMHESTFRGACLESGLNPYLYEQVNIREQCSWVNPPGSVATEKAKELIRAAVCRVALHHPLNERAVPVQGQCVIVGGGIAGLAAALDVADAGFEVTLVEKAAGLGGEAVGLYHTFPTLEPIDTLLKPLIASVQAHPRISVLLNTAVDNVTGYIGNFEITVRKNGEATVLPAGTVIIATGYAPFDPHLKPELGYGKYSGVVSTRDLERLLREQPRALDGVRDVVFVQCVGSRDKQVGNPYCSRLCCMVSAKQAHLLVQLLPDAHITVLYIDVRAFGKGFEELYDQVRREGVRYRRGNASEVIRRGERLVVRAEDSLLRQPVDLEADLVVLSVGLTPRADAESVSQLFKLARSDDGFFMERHPKLGPVETSVDGVYLAGACQSPKDIAETVAHAKAAASAALIPMLRHQVKVESAVSNAIPEMCAGCGLCAANCPYGALAVDTRLGAIRVNPALCKGCGACSNVCPSNAIKVEHFRPEQILAQIDGLLFPG